LGNDKLTFNLQIPGKKCLVLTTIKVAKFTDGDLFSSKKSSQNAQISKQYLRATHLLSFSISYKSALSERFPMDNDSGLGKSGCIATKVRKSVRFGWLYVMNSDLGCVYL